MGNPSENVNSLLLMTDEVSITEHTLLIKILKDCQPPARQNPYLFEGLLYYTEVPNVWRMLTKNGGRL